MVDRCVCEVGHEEKLADPWDFLEVLREDLLAHLLECGVGI